MEIYEIASEILNHIEMTRAEGAPLLRDPEYQGPCSAVNPAAIEDIATTMLDIFANVIATIIDAGSERDAVNENFQLLDMLKTELSCWTAQG